MELPAFPTPRKSVEPGLPCSPTQLSSEGLSSPPRSSPEAASPSAHPSNEALPITKSTTSSSSVTPSVTSILASSVHSEKPPPQRKPRRKPKDPVTSLVSGTTQSSSQTNLTTAIAAGTEAPSKPKRIRKPKDPNAPPAQRRKKNVAPNKTSENATDSKVTAVRTLPSQLSEPMLAANAAQVLYSQAKKIEESHGTIQSFFINALPPTSSPPIQPQTQTRTSGQKYDPIRSSNYDPVRETVVRHEMPNTLTGFQIKSNTGSHRISSKSIPSVIDTQNQQQSLTPTNVQSFFNQKQTRIPPCNASSVPSAQDSNEPLILTNLNNSEPLKPIVSASTTKKSDSNVSLNATKKSNVNVTGTSVSPKSIKPRDLKETSNNISPTPPPLPGSGNESSDGTEYRAPTVILSIPINGEVNKYVNFTRLAEQQYGWDALHPRLAAQRDRLARVAAAGAALERNGSNKDSGDEMSLDSEAEGSNAEMGGMSDGRPGADCIKKVPKKRKMREDEYDKDDGFVDDTELLWEEQAAATNDGFFVYSGPLIPEGEKAGIDSKADSATKRGRGRGTRGGAARSSSTRAGTSNTTTAARNNLPATGPGSRGGTGVRKPRITKAERARIEEEKLAREKSLHLSTQSSSSNLTVLANPSTEGDVQMLLSQ